MRASLRRLRRGHPWLFACAAVACALAVAVPVVSAFTLSPAPLNANDGNLIEDGDRDWTTVAPPLAYKLDEPTGQTDDSFGNGTKEDTAVPSVIDGSIPNNKSDLVRFLVDVETVTDIDEDPDKLYDYLYLGWMRVQDPSGTTNMDFELNQSNDISTNGVTPVRTEGDVLIKYDLSKGGVVPTFGIHRWVVSGDASEVCEAANNVPCWGKVKPLDGSTATGRVNTGSITNPFATPPGPSLDPRTFGEAAINLQRAGIFADTCVTFGQAYLKSRSSDSFTAALKDFIAPEKVNINNCPPDQIRIKKLDSRDGAALAGAKFRLWLDKDDSGTVNAGDEAILPKNPSPAGNFECTTTADGIGNCLFDVTQSGTYIAVETQAPPGYQPAPPQTQTVTIDRTADVFTLTFNDTPEPGKITVTKVDDSTPPVPLGGAKFQLWQDVNGNGTLETGTDTKIGGECTTPSSGTSLGICEFTGLAPGKYLVEETAAPPGYDLPATTVQAVEIVVAAGGDAKTVTFVDPPTKGSITVEKRDSVSNALLGGAKFQLWSDTNNNGTLETGTDVKIGGECTTPSSGIDLGLCTFGPLVPGRYLVEETAAPAGYDLPSQTVQAVTITIKPGGDHVTITFLDPLTKGSITVNKVDDDDPAIALGGAKFQLWNDVNDNDALDAGDTKVGGVCTTPSSTSGNDVLGQCRFTDLVPGEYLVEETQAPPGHDLPAETVKAVTITIKTGGDHVTISFTNPRRFTVITIVCQEAGPKLYPSTVVLDGSTKTSLAAGDLPSGVSEAEACSLGGARYEGKPFGGPYAGSVTIPK